MASNRREQHPQRVNTRLSGARGGDSCGATWGRRTRCRVRAAAFAPTGMREFDTKFGCAATGRRSSKADRFGAFSSLHPPTWCRRRSTARRHRSKLAAPLDRQGAALQIERTSYGFRTRRSAARSRTRRRTTTSAPRLHRAVHRADPAEQRAQRGDAAHAGGRRDHDVHFIAWNGSDNSGSMPILRKSTCCNGRGCGRGFNASARRQNVQQDRGAMKEGNSRHGASPIRHRVWEAWAYQRPLGERLGASDVAVAAFRRLMVEPRVRCKTAPATHPSPAPAATISSYEGVVPKAVNWDARRRSEAPRANASPETGITKAKLGGER